MTDKVLYRGNCHCARFRFEVRLPEIKSAIFCNCVACSKSGILWAFPEDGDYKITRDDGLLTTTGHGGALEHKFCSNCLSPVSGTHSSGPLEGRFGINIRTLLNINPFHLELDESTHPTANNNASDNVHDAEVDTEGFQTYKSSCTCGAVKLTFKTQPLPKVEIKEDNCSICVRIAYIGVYPDKSQLEIPPSAEANTSTYVNSQGLSGWRFCRHCGIHVYRDLYGPPAELVATWPEARQAMVARKLAIKPLNVRALEGVEWDRIKIDLSDEGTDGYVVD